MIFVMVVIGGITRLTLSGLSITEWQPVIGIVPPLSPADWAAEFDKYQQIPQYRLLNYGMSLDEFKTIYLWEYVHRLWGRLIGFAYALPFLYFRAAAAPAAPFAGPLAGILALGFAEGALGWYMVESGLVDRVEVSQYRLVAHLALALLDLCRDAVDRARHLLQAPLPHAGEGGEAQPRPGEGGGDRLVTRPLTPALSPGGGEGDRCGAAPPRRCSASSR